MTTPLKRAFAWTVFVALLAAIGYAVHLLLPPATRWQLQGPITILGVTADPITAQVFRWNDCRPQPVVGHLERLAEARASLAAFPGLLVAGGAFDGVGIPDCVRQGSEAAKTLVT